MFIAGKLRELDLIQYLLATNSETLTTFNLKVMRAGSITSLNFLYSNPNLKITDFEIVFENTPQASEIASDIRFQLRFVKYLALTFIPSTLFENNEHTLLPWKANLIKWIIKICPNLKELNLLIMPRSPGQFQFEVEHISTLIYGLPNLTNINLKIDLRSWSNEENSKNLSIEAEEWIFSNCPKSYPVGVSKMGCKSYCLPSRMQP